ncbi:MAG: transcriptional regulator [Cellulomonas sp. 73-145]|uniref:helix-turn-helix transcriptional regulator n=1 Tax=Cellulomonas sp. 73-145 TaxID=1895739 RepID=UPI0009259D3B|nr:YafY family protein [Cellulomonas sp. 73-145]MBN9327044.1 YafY family transcriptional regulator [Cellulomonas sp.]OJV58790.1 MAG: transcriptional regulator [Cellulomonas sp. 73-145]
MTRPTARVLALLEILQAGGTRTAADLAQRLGVDERTVRRYVEHLVDLGVPVESVRGRYGGIHLVPGYRMPPLMLTDDEALAVVLGLVGSRRSGSAGTGGVPGASTVALESATAKVLRVLPKTLARRLDALLTGVRFTMPTGDPATVQADHLLVVAEAARDRRPVALDYTDSQGRRSSRTVHPYGIVAHAGRWYVTAADPSAPGVRTFRVDRIEALTTLPGSFEVPEGFDPAGALLQAVAGAPRRHAVRLRVQAPADAVRGMFPAGIATLRDTHDTDDTDDEGWTRVVIQVERLDWVPTVLAGVPVPFVVDGPEELWPLLRALADRLTAAAAAAPAVAAAAAPAAEG